MDDEREAADDDADPAADDADASSTPSDKSTSESQSSDTTDDSPDAESSESTSESAPQDDETSPDSESRDDPDADSTGADSPSETEPVNPEVASAAIDGDDDPQEPANEPDLTGPIQYGEDAPPVSSTVDEGPEPPESRYMSGPTWKGPGDDQEMPLAAHIEEMLKRLAVVVAVAGVVSLITFPAADGFLNFLWNSILPQGEFTRPRLYGILELKLTELKVASLAGLIIALPVFVYQTYKFMRPGLYPHERRYYLAAIPTSLVLAFVGVSFAYFIILPAIFTYFLYYSQDVATIGFGLGKTFDLILLLMGYMAIVFQIPLFILLAMMMNLVTRQWLADRRLLFWGGFLGISFIFSPDPTGMAPIVVALTMIFLFEGTLFLVKWTRRGRARAKGSS